MNEAKTGRRTYAWMGRLWLSFVDMWRWRTFLLSVASNLPASAFANGAIRPRLLRWAGVKAGKGLSIGPGFDLVLGDLTIGTYVYVNNNCRFDAAGGISIGSYCQVGPRVSIETFSHEVAPVPQGHRRAFVKPVIVADHVWIGANVVILPGVTIHEGAVIAAGAVVADDVQAMTIAGGVPARVIGRIE